MIVGLDFFLNKHQDCSAKHFLPMGKPSEAQKRTSIRCNKKNADTP